MALHIVLFVMSMTNQLTIYLFPVFSHNKYGVKFCICWKLLTIWSIIQLKVASSDTLRMGEMFTFRQGMPCVQTWKILWHDQYILTSRNTPNIIYCKNNANGSRLHTENQSKVTKGTLLCNNMVLPIHWFIRG